MEIRQIRADITCPECMCVWTVHMDDTPRKEVTCPACGIECVVTVEIVVTVEPC